MNKLHTFLLPIAVGSFGLLWTPLSENSIISYGIIAFAIIAGIIGLHSAVKQLEENRTSQQEMVKVMGEIVQKSMEEAVTLQQKQTGILEESNGTVVNEIKQISIAIVEQMEKRATSLIGSITDEHEKLVKAITLLEEKMDEGNKILENVSLLMIRELKTVVQQTEEIVSIQSTMPNELSTLQDEISRNQQDALESSRNIEQHLETLSDLQSIVQTHLETSSNTHKQVVSKITDEFTTLGANLDSTTSTLINQLIEYNNRVHNQLNIASTMLEKLENQQMELGNINEKSAENVNAQLNELRNLNKSLVAGIAQIADSKSAERQQLLKIQKDLMKKFSG